MKNAAVAHKSANGQDLPESGILSGVDAWLSLHHRHAIGRPANRHRGRAKTERHQAYDDEHSAQDELWRGLTPSKSYPTKSVAKAIVGRKV